MVCFVQRENKSVYDSIKKKALQAGIPTQFVKERTVGKNMGSVALKVALQMACKCGGEPWSVAMPKTIGWGRVLSLIFAGKLFLVESVNND